MAAQFLLSGSLEEVPLPDIARLFQSTRKTGRLTLISGKSTGALFFARGVLVDCQSINMSGLEALKHIALFNRGSFEYTDGVPPSDETLVNYAAIELIGILESRMQESRQLQELMPSGSEIPRYQGGAIPDELEVNAADLAIALRSAAGVHSVRRLAVELNLDETTVRFTVARLRAAGLMEIVGEDELASTPLPPAPVQPDPPLPPSDDSAPGNPVRPAPGKSRFWLGRNDD